MIRIRLLGNKIHVAPLAKKTRSEGGIALPVQYDDDEKQWLILGVGPGKRLPNGVFVAPECKPGERAYIDMGMGSTQLDDGSWITDASQVKAVW